MRWTMPRPSGLRFERGTSREARESSRLTSGMLPFSPSSLSLSPPLLPRFFFLFFFPTFPAVVLCLWKHTIPLGFETTTKSASSCNIRKSVPYRAASSSAASVAIISPPTVSPSSGRPLRRAARLAALRIFDPPRFLANLRALSRTLFATAVHAGSPPASRAAYARQKVTRSGAATSKSPSSPRSSHSSRRSRAIPAPNSPPPSVSEEIRTHPPNRAFAMLADGPVLPSAASMAATMSSRAECCRRRSGAAARTASVSPSR
mmetsp:Transcript_39486/g.72851  ORF Transcript_39486/g.72851 Transcript_39486/m.72851 type:complete len:261 (+) Transcript_39486:829-1611(+)